MCDSASIICRCLLYDKCSDNHNHNHNHKTKTKTKTNSKQYQATAIQVSHEDPNRTLIRTSYTLLKYKTYIKMRRRRHHNYRDFRDCLEIRRAPLGHSHEYTIYQSLFSKPKLNTYNLMSLTLASIMLFITFNTINCKPNDHQRADNIIIGTATNKFSNRATQTSPISSSTTTSTTTTSTTSLMSTKLQHEDNMNSNIDDNNQSRMQTYENTTNFQCPEQFGYYTDTRDCGRYYVCVFGEVIHESCTGGLRFSRELQTCDWPRNVDCPQGTKQIENGTTTTSTLVTPSATATTQAATTLRQLGHSDSEQNSKKNQMSTSTSLSGIVRQNSDSKLDQHKDSRFKNSNRGDDDDDDGVTALPISSRSHKSGASHPSMAFADEASDPQQPNFDEAISPVITSDGSIHLHDGSGGTFGLLPNQQPESQPGQQHLRSQQSSGSVDVFVRPLSVLPSDKQARQRTNQQTDKRVSLIKPQQQQSVRGQGNEHNVHISHVANHDHNHQHINQHSQHQSQPTATTLRDEYNVEESADEGPEELDGDGSAGEENEGSSGLDSISAQADREYGEDSVGQDQTGRPNDSSGERETLIPTTPARPSQSLFGPERTATTNGYIPPVSPSDRQRNHHHSQIHPSSQLLSINNRPIQDASNRQAFKPIIAPSLSTPPTTTTSTSLLFNGGNNYNNNFNLGSNKLAQNQRSSLINQIDMIENPIVPKQSLTSNAHHRQNNNLTLINLDDHSNSFHNQHQQNVRPSRMSNLQHLNQPQNVAFSSAQQGNGLSNNNHNNLNSRQLQQLINQMNNVNNFNDNQKARRLESSTGQHGHMAPANHYETSSISPAEVSSGSRSQNVLFSNQPFGLIADSNGPTLDSHLGSSQPLNSEDEEGPRFSAPIESDDRGSGIQNVGMTSSHLQPFVNHQRRPRPPKRQQIPTSSTTVPSTNRNRLLSTVSLQSVPQTSPQLHNMNARQKVDSITTTQATTNTFLPNINSPADFSETEEPLIELPIQTGLPPTTQRGHRQQQPDDNLRSNSNNNNNRINNQDGQQISGHSFLTSPATPTVNPNPSELASGRPQQPNRLLNNQQQQQGLNSNNLRRLNVNNGNSNSNNNNNNAPPQSNIEVNGISVGSVHEPQAQNSLAANSISGQSHKHQNQHQQQLTSQSLSLNNNDNRAIDSQAGSSFSNNPSNFGPTSPSGQSADPAISGLEAGVGQPFGAIDYEFDILNDNSTERRQTSNSQAAISLQQANNNRAKNGQARNQTSSRNSLSNSSSSSNNNNNNANRSARLHQSIDLGGDGNDLRQDHSIGSGNNGQQAAGQSVRAGGQSNSIQSVQAAPSSTSSQTGTNSLSGSSSGGKKPRPSNKKITVNHEQALANNRASTEPARRPDSIFSTPNALQTATKCDNRICRLPDCKCGDSLTPSGLDPKQIPQIVLLTFDDAVNDLNWEIYEELFNGRVNPNGCPILATFYVSHEWTDYGQVQTLYSRGHEMASHSITHSFGEKFSKSQWFKEINGQREILNMYGGVKMNDVRGMRAPFLQIGGNKMFEMLYDANFTYDSSMPVFENSPPLWPYTLDYQLSHECMITPCPTKSFPGVWEVGMSMWLDLRGGRCSMGDACSNPPDEDGVYEMLMKNFNRHYKSNRAPFGLFYHSAWFNTVHHRRGFLRFLATVNGMPDAFFVTNWQMIQWIRKPTPLSEINSFEPWQCPANNDRPPPCFHPSVCNVKSEHGTRFMKTCQPCPANQQYPWVGSTGFKAKQQQASSGSG